MKITILFQKYTIITLLSTIFIFSCNRNPKEYSNVKEIVTLYTYYIQTSDIENKRIQRCELAYIDIKDYHNRKTCFFAVDDSISINYAYAIEKDSLFLLDQKFVYCPNIDTIRLEYKKEEITLIKSKFDIIGSFDEESWIYWNHDYGIIAIYNHAWGVNVIVVEKESMKGFATQTFYDYFIEEIVRSLPPPPLPISSTENSTK
jgi:hypothetical protein